MASLRLPASLDNLDPFRRFVLERAETLFPDAIALPSKLDLALEEVLVNVVSYAYPPSAPGDLEVVCEAASETGEPQFALTIIDWGAPFDPLDAREPDTTLSLDERQPGGLGLHLIRHMTTAITYEREGDANKLTMYFEPA